MSALELYFLLKLDDIGSFLLFTGIIGLCALVPLFVFGFDDDEKLSLKPFNFDDDEKLPLKPFNFVPLKPFKIVAAIVVLIFIIFTVIPSTKQMAVIIVAPKIINNEKVQEMPDRILGLANEWLEELKPETKEK